MKKSTRFRTGIWVPLLLVVSYAVMYLSLFPIYDVGSYTPREIKLLIINSCFFVLVFAVIYFVFLYFYSNKHERMKEGYGEEKIEKLIEESEEIIDPTLLSAHPEMTYVKEGKDFVTSYLIKALHLLQSEDREVRKDAIGYLVKAVEHHDRRAAVLLGLLYERGVIVKRDVDKALEVYNIAIELGSKNAYLLKAKIYEGREEKVSCYNAKKAAKAGVPEGLNYLGNKYYPRDKKKAKLYYDLAIDRGSEVAYYNNALLSYNVGKLREMNKYWSSYLTLKQ